MAEVQLGKMLQSAPSSSQDVEVPYLRAGHLSQVPDELPKMWASRRDIVQYRVETGDILVAEGGDVGRVGFVPQSASGALIQNSLHRIRPKGGRDRRFLAYVLEAVHLGDWLEVLCNKSTFGHLTVEKLTALRVPDPPTAEQRAIADYLDTETARIDALITKKQRMIELLQVRWRAEVAHRMAWLANEFGTVQLRHLARCLDGRRVPLSTEERSGRAGDFPYFGASGIVDQVDSYIFDETLVLLGEDGAQLGVADYPIAQVVTGKIWVNNHAHVLRPVAADPVFLVLHLNTFDRVPYISGGTREKITQDDMNRIPVPNVDLSRQRKEADRLSAVRARNDSTSQLLAQQIELLREHRQALITAAVTGELEVPGVAA